MIPRRYGGSICTTIHYSHYKTVFSTELLSGTAVFTTLLHKHTMSHKTVEEKDERRVSSTALGMFDYHTSYFVTVALSNTVCVCVFSSHSFWTSSSLDVPAGVIQEEGHTGFLIHLLYAVRALVFLARRIQPFLSLVDREVEFCVVTI